MKKINNWQKFNEELNPLKDYPTRAELDKEREEEGRTTRFLTDEETKVLNRYFKNKYDNTIDSKGRIVIWTKSGRKVMDKLNLDILTRYETLKEDLKNELNKIDDINFDFNMFNSKLDKVKDFNLRIKNFLDGIE